MLHRSVSVVHERWTLVPTETPRVVRRCPRCDVARRFVSSDLFRVNAHQKRVDVWLIYRCESCDFTWNHTVFFRRTPDELGRELYQRFIDNDRDEAWRRAFDARALRASGAVVELDVPFRVERERVPRPAGGEPGEGLSVVLAFDRDRPIEARLERVLARELGMSRGELRRAVDRGEIFLSGGAGALGKRITGAETVRVRSNLATTVA